MQYTRQSSLSMTGRGLAHISALFCHSAEPPSEPRSMKRVVIGICLALVIVATANLFPGRAQETGAPVPLPPGNPAATNPLKVALLKWYKGNLTTSFTVGQQPYGVAFDGENIWTANSGDGTVTKLRAADGATLGTFKVGTTPYGVTFDGANVWVSNSSDGSVTKLRASDGKTLGTFKVGQMPFWMVFDGEDVWVANSGDGTVTKLRANDGKALGTFNTNGAIALAFDGTYIWVSTYTDQV